MRSGSAWQIGSPLRGRLGPASEGVGGVLEVGNHDACVLDSVGARLTLSARGFDAAHEAPDGLFERGVHQVRPSGVCSQPPRFIRVGLGRDAGPVPAGRASEVAVGSNAACARLERQARSSAGAMTHRTSLTPPVNDVRGLSLAGRTACALDAADEAVCWGADTDGVLDVPDGQFVSVSVGGGTMTIEPPAEEAHACGLHADGSVACWGNNDYGQCDPPVEVEAWAVIRAGRALTCGITREGDLHCWGDDRWGIPTTP